MLVNLKMATLYGVVFIAAVVLILRHSTDGATTYINSPGYPSAYKPVNIWRTPAPVKPINGGMRVKLTVTMMDLAVGDTVGIYDGSSCNASGLLETFKWDGGPHPNKVYFSTLNSFCIMLQAPTGYGKGFSMKTEEVFGCRGTYTEDKGDIISPGFPIENYETSTNCKWSVSVDQGQRIEYKVMELDFDPARNSSCRTFLTLSGVQADYTGKICQPSLKGKTIVSTSTDSDVVFQSRQLQWWEFFFNSRHDSSGHKGFWLAYKTIGCKAKLLPASSDTTGHHINKNTYYANSYIAKYACNPGYSFSDKTHENLFTCHEDTQWYGTKKQCVEIRCGNPPAPADSTVSLSNEDKMNSVATYTCDSNFIMDGKNKRTCLGDGTWSGKTPVCNYKGIRCGNPPAPANGKVFLSHEDKINSVAIYTCNCNFIMDGKNKRSCLGDGTWSGKTPVCKEIRCGNPPAPAHGKVSLSNEDKMNSVATYACNINFTMDGKDKRTCLGDGTWSGTTPDCKEITCQPPMPPHNGFLVTNATTFGSTAIFKCLPGYKINGSKAIECLPSGNWSGVEPVCELITCPGLRNPYDGKMVLSGLMPGNTATFSCNLGFDLIGSETMNCTANGSWSSRPPFCSEVRCPDLQKATNAYTMSSANRYQDVVVYRCDPDYFLDSNRSITEVNVTCQADGVWSENITGCWYRSEVTCQPPMPPHKGFLVSNATTLGSTAIFKCLPGYKINGSKAIECLPSGNWSGVEPVCELITCPDLSNPYDGKMILSGLTPGNTAEFSCNPGFDLIGPETMNCAADGSWSSPPPFCSKVFCPVLSKNATNGQPMSSANRYQDVVVYQCDPDYFLDSDRSITEVNVTCQADGVWSENITGCWYRSETTLKPTTSPTTETSTPTTITEASPTTPLIHPTWGNGCRFVPAILSYKVLETWFDPSVDVCKDKCSMDPMCSSFTAYKYGSLVSCMLYSERENQGQRLTEYRKVCH